MPIDGPLRRGDVVRVHGARYTLRPNGTSAYLYANADDARHTRTIATYVLRRDGERVAIAPPRRARRVREEDIRYLYVVRDCDLPRGERALKIGITSSVPATLRTYHRVLPNAQAVLVVDCEGAARALERELQRVFAAFRVDRSEVFAVRPHEVTRALVRAGFHRDADSLFRRREPA